MKVVPVPVGGRIPPVGLGENVVAAAEETRVAEELLEAVAGSKGPASTEEIADGEGRPPAADEIWFCRRKSGDDEAEEAAARAMTNEKVSFMMADEGRCWLD